MRWREDETFPFCLLPAACRSLGHLVILKDILIRISPPTRLNKKTLLLRAWLDLVFLLVLVSSLWLWSSRTHYYYKVFYTKHLGFFLLYVHPNWIRFWPMSNLISPDSLNLQSTLSLKKQKKKNLFKLLFGFFTVTSHHAQWLHNPQRDYSPLPIGNTNTQEIPLLLSVAHTAVLLNLNALRMSKNGCWSSDICTY